MQSSHVKRRCLKMTKRPWQFNLGPDYKITPYQYKYYKSSTISNTFREYKNVHACARVYETNKVKRKMGPDIPVGKYRYVPKKPVYTGVYGDKPRPEKSTRSDDIKQPNYEKAQTSTTTKPAQEIAYQILSASPKPLKQIEFQIWKTPPSEGNPKKPFVPPLNLGESETRGILPEHTGCVECHSFDVGHSVRELTDRVVINSPAPEHEPSDGWESNSATLDRSCIWTPIGSPPIFTIHSRPFLPPTPETNIVPVLAFRHAPPYQLYGLSHPNLVRGKFRAETPVLKGKHQKTLPSNVVADINSDAKPPR